MRHITALVLASLAGAAAQAGDISVSGAWIADAPPAAMTRAAYVTLENTSDADIGIVAVSAEGFGMARLHESKMKDDGVMMMHAVHQLDLAPGVELEMAPGGLHIMLMHPKAPVAEGDTVALTFTLSDAKTLSVDAVVQAGPGDS